MNKEELEILLNKMYYDYVDREEAQKIIDYIKNLEKENQELKKQIEEYQKALDDTMSEKMDLEEENQKYKEVIDKLKELIESKNNGVCVINGKEKEAFTFLLDFDKAREFIWKLLDILKEVE